MALQKERYELEQVHKRCLDDYLVVRDEVQKELEAQFVASNRDDLEKVRDDG